jgi:hypothetical protein
MLTSKPPDNDRTKAPPRSGHGAASVIPHLNEIFRSIPQGEAEPDAETSLRQAPCPETPDDATDSKPVFP